MANTSQRRMKEPSSYHKRIPIGRPSGHVAPLDRQVGHRKKDPLKVPAPPLVEINVAKKGGGLSKHTGITSSEELLDMDLGEPTIPAPVTDIDSTVSHQATEEINPISVERYLPNETNFYFSDSLQVPAQDVPTGDTEHNHLIQDSGLDNVSAIPITYKRVWDPFSPQSQSGSPTDTATTHQPYPSHVSSTHPTRFDAPSSSAEPNIHPPTSSLSSASKSMIPNDDPPVPNFQIASHTLMNTPRGRDLARLEDCLSEDIPIRAVLQGWDSIGERWELPPFWQTIRVLDELIFGNFDTVVRLASLRVVHLLMRYHSDPSPERARTMPKFYNLKYVCLLSSSRKTDERNRGLDFDSDYNIENFIPWPGIRALAQNPRASFRSDKFFDLETSTLKILWPFSLQDCFTQDPSTGLFKITASFDKRIYDINAWTFGPEMFESFPDLYGVAPAFNSIPGKVDEVRKRTWWVMSDDERTDEVGDGKENQIVRRRKGDGLGIDVRGLKWHKFNDRGKRSQRSHTLLFGRRKVGERYDLRFMTY